MTRDEAIVYLAACKPLAHTLDTQGVNIELTDEDRAALEGFNKVRLNDWLGVGTFTGWRA